MSCSLTLNIGEHNVVEWQNLTNSVTGIADTGATVTVTVKDRAGVEVSGQTWPATLTHDTGGTYRATLDDDLLLIEGREYVAELTATGAGAEKGFRKVTATAGYHDCT